MVGGTLRNVMSLYRRRSDADRGSDAVESSGRKGGGWGRKKGGGKRRKKGGGRAPSPVPSSSSSSSEEDFVPSVEERQAAEDEEHKNVDEGEEHEEEDAAGGSTSSEESTVWLRSPSTLPRRPIPLESRIEPKGKRSWIRVSPGIHKRKANGILGLLCREYFPGLVQFAGRSEPAYTFVHYVAVPDFEDRDDRVFANRAERVKAELWDFYRCAPGSEQSAAPVAHTACLKLVKDMHYESRVQAIIDYYAAIKVKIAKVDARNMRMSREQYLATILWWCASHPQCWEAIVDKWCNPEWEEMHNACRERRLLMPGVTHHQGSLSLDEYAERWSSSHGGKPCPRFKAYALAHKGKATSDVQYNPEDPTSAYSNATIHSRLNAYVEVAKEVHGPDFDLTAHDLDGEVVMRVGGGKKHGRYYIGDSTIDTATTPTLSQIRARSTSADPAIRPRPTSALLLQARLEEETKRREELELTAQHMQMQQRTIEELERERQQQMEQMYAWMQSVGARMGEAPPPMIFRPRPPISPNPGSAAASNDGPQDEDLLHPTRVLFPPPTQ